VPEPGQVLSLQPGDEIALLNGSAFCRFQLTASPPGPASSQGSLAAGGGAGMMCESQQATQAFMPPPEPQPEARRVSLASPLPAAAALKMLNVGPTQLGSQYLRAFHGFFIPLTYVDKVNGPRSG
jgi:hypothetical protein